jgi:hypothetical protein
MLPLGTASKEHVLEKGRISSDWPTLLFEYENFTLHLCKMDKVRCVI